MGKAGRKRKTGTRYPSGQLRPVFDRGNDRVQHQREIYGTHYNTALGRAYAGGLLGEPDIALDRYQGGKRFIRVYTRMIGGEVYRCPLDQTPRGSGTIDFRDIEQDKRDHDWLHVVMVNMDEAGVRPWLDDLITTRHADEGPYWLDALLAGGKHPADRMILDAAIAALDILTPVRKPMGIVAVAY